MDRVATPLIRAVVVSLAVALCSTLASADEMSLDRLVQLQLDHMATDRWAKLREAERFQLNAAERLYKEGQWKQAADEYEKFLKLYEKSEGASYAQLKYSHCLVRLRKQNAAIKDGYQSLLDYYPDSPEAPIAGLMIGVTHRSVGDVKPAKKAYAAVIKGHPKHFAGVWARLDLVAMAVKENDPDTRASLLRQLTYDVERKGPTSEPCADASRQYARLTFRAGNFEEGLKALATSCTEAQLPKLLMHQNWGAFPQIVSELTGSKDEPQRQLGEKLAEAGANWLKGQVAERLKDAKTKPAAMETWYDVAEVRQAARQPDKQKAIYEEILASQGADDRTLGLLAQWYKDNKQRDTARGIYAKFKDAIAGQAAIGHSYEEEQQYDKAVEVYRKLALSDTAASPKWLGAAAWAYRRGGKPDQAIAIYRELLTSDAKNADQYHIAVADTLYGAQRWKECITAYRGTNNFPTNYQHMAWANRQLKQYDEAITLYRQIIASSMSNDLTAASYREISETQEAAGRKEEAIKTLKLICDKYPKTGSGSYAHNRLNEVYKIPVTLGGAKD